MLDLLGADQKTDVAALSVEVSKYLVQCLNLLFIFQ